MKIVYHFEAPRDEGSGTVNDQLKWAIEQAEPQSRKLLTSMRESAAEDGGTVELVETYVDVDSHDIGMFGMSAPRARLAVVVSVLDHQGRDR